MSDIDPLGPPPFDAVRLVHDLRQGAPEALDEAYRRTFGGAMGRLVLGHFLVLCGVGSKLGGLEVSDVALRYAVGRHDAAIELATLAHFDAPGVVGGIAVGELMGDDDEPADYQYTPLDGDGFDDG